MDILLLTNVIPLSVASLGHADRPSPEEIVPSRREQDRLCQRHDAVAEDGSAGHRVAPRLATKEGHTEVDKV